MTGPEVTAAAMEAEGVDPALVEKAERTLAFGICRDNSPVDGVKCDCPTDEQIRVVIAAVMPEIQAQALREAADRLHARTDGVNREGTKGWPERHREVYAHAIDEASDALREDAARLTTTTGEPTT